jgi:hypothetical protein
MFNPIPFEPSFDTSFVTRMYAGLPFPSGCLDSKEEDGLSFDLDFSGLRDPKSMLQFLYVCDEMLSKSSEGYSSSGEGYDLTRECLHIDSEIPEEVYHLSMPQEDDWPPPCDREVGEPGRAQTPPGSHVAPLKQLRELHNKLRDEQQRLQQLRQALEREAASKALDGGARAKAHDIQRRIEEYADVAAPPSSTEPVKVSQRPHSCSAPCQIPPPPRDTASMANFGGFCNALQSIKPRALLLDSESPPQVIRRGPLASRGRPRCTLRLPERGHPWCVIVSETTARPPQVQKLLYAVVLARRKLHHYFESLLVMVVSSFPLREIIQSREVSGRVAMNHLGP